MKIRVVAGFAVAASLGLTALWSFAEVKEIRPEDVPAKVAAAVKAKWPKAKVKDVELQQEKDKTLFNMDLTETSGKLNKKWGVSVTADGKIVEIQEPADLADVPKTVFAALAKKYPLVKKPRVYRVTEGEGAVAKVSYDFRFMTQMRIDATGKAVDEIELEIDEGKEE